MCAAMLHLMKMAANVSDTDSDDIMAFYLFTRRRKRKRRYRRICIHPILQKRHIYGEYHHLVKELHFHPDKFHRYFRMTEEQFDYALGLMKRTWDSTNWRKAITPRERLAISV